MIRKIERRRFSAGLAALLGAVVAAATLGTPGVAMADQADDHADTQEVLNRYKAIAGPGAAVHAGNRTSSWDLHAGSASIKATVPIGSGDQFRAASQTKTFTAVVVLQLVDEGKVDLDAPIERYLPGVVNVNGHDGTKISVRQLLQHTSGIARAMGSPKAGPDGTYSLREVARAGMAAAGPQAAPGTRWIYSNTNYALAGLLIEQITGAPAGDAITERIINPLGLTRTSYPRPGDRKLDTPYLPGYMGGRAGPLFFWADQTFAHELSKWATAGALASTEQDLAKFDQALADGKLISPAALAQMRTTVPTPDYPVVSGYGLGLMKLDLSCGGRAWGHTGDLTTGHSSGTFATDDGRRAAMVTNAYTSDGKTTRIDVLDSALCGTPVG
ncbi:serine hydrolase domain-containing protein [Spirillospora sp. NPDC127200]